MGVDQIHHGPRNPATVGPEGLVFNFANPRAPRQRDEESVGSSAAQR